MEGPSSTVFSGPCSVESRTWTSSAGFGRESLSACSNGVLNWPTKGSVPDSGSSSSYSDEIGRRQEAELLTELSVDRTKILRGTGHPDLKPPYEGLYAREKGMGDSVLEVRRFYRKAGLLPDEAVPEPADFLCVELDFMRQLCLREQEEWSSGGAAAETIALQREFLAEHLGRWVGDFCRALQAHGITGFYRGIGLILGAFVRTELEWAAGTCVKPLIQMGTDDPF